MLLILLHFFIVMVEPDTFLHMDRMWLPDGCPESAGPLPVQRNPAIGMNLVCSYSLGEESKEAWGDVEENNWSPAISSVTTSGDYMAVGDDSGMIHVMECDAKSTGVPRYVHRSRQRSYVSEIDPLNSVKFMPCVNALSFVPSVGPHPLLLVTNERAPKLYKMVHLAEPLPHYSAESFLASGRLPRLLSTPGYRTAEEGGLEDECLSLQLVSGYAPCHETSITALCSLGVGGEQFSTSDYFSIRLWCTERPDSSIETFSLLNPGDSDTLEPMEVIQAMHTFPQCPSLIFAGTSGGKVHLLDTRQSLQWRQNSVVLDFSSSADQGRGDWGANLLMDCALSPSGSQVAARDFMSVTLLDLRRCEQRKSVALSRWDLHPHVARHQEFLQQNDAYSERFQLQFLNNDTILTGGLNNQLYALDINQRPCRNQQKDRGAGQQVIHLSQLQPAHEESTLQGATDQLLNRDSSYAFEGEEETRRPWPTVISRPLRSNQDHGLTTFCVSSGATLLQCSSTVVPFAAHKYATNSFSQQTATQIKKNCAFPAFIRLFNVFSFSFPGSANTLLLTANSIFTHSSICLFFFRFYLLLAVNKPCTMAPKKSTRSRSRSQSKGHTATRAKRTPSSSKQQVRRRATSPKSAAPPPPAALTTEETFYAETTRTFMPEKDMWDGTYDFGGPLGALGIMIFSHFLVYYLFICLDRYQGTIIYPGHPMLQGEPMYRAFWGHIKDLCVPTPFTFFSYLAFLLMEYIMALILPGVIMRGLPVPSENGHRFSYKCNAAMAWFVILGIMGVAQVTGVFDIKFLRHHFGRFITTAVILADTFSVICYVVGLKRQIRTTPSKIYNFFMGSQLNYRLPGDVDVKLFFECRNSWIILMMHTLSFAAVQQEETGHISKNMMFMLLAHFLYVNAIQKGEECIVTTWDIYHEKFGWMLCFWNTCGVPFVYCMQPLYIQTVLKDKEHPTWVLVIMTVALLAVYFVWDTMNSQKNRFRMQQMGVPMSVIKRRTFPQLPWNFIENPKYLKSKAGTLFIDGWYQYARKLHYTVDVAMAFLWGASCGFDSFIPFYYMCFFTLVLIDRERRDAQRCQNKYGKLWDEYVRVVPYRFIPYIW
eukprot:gene4520-3307_t